MRKAQQRVLTQRLTGQDEFKKMLEELEEEFKRDGQFTPHRHTTSYVEVPSHTKYEWSSTYILRQYKGIDLVTFGNSVFFIKSPELEKLLRLAPTYKVLGAKPINGKYLRVVRAEDCFFYMNEEGRAIQQEILKGWEKLTQPVFAVNISKGGNW